MDSWLTYTDYQERCPDTTLTEAEFRGSWQPKLRWRSKGQPTGGRFWRRYRRRQSAGRVSGAAGYSDVQSGRRQRRTGKSVRCNECQQPRLFRELRRSAEHTGCDPAAAGSADPAGSVRSGYPLDDLRRCGLSPRRVDAEEVFFRGQASSGYQERQFYPPCPRRDF